MGRVIFHIDLNAFFPSAEQIKNSSLEGQAIAVASLNRRSVVSSASYEARAYGVNSAMPIAQAMRLCPNLIIVEGDYNYYELLSERFFHYLRSCCPYLEPASIDECYLDVTDIIKNYKRPLDLAWTIQKKVYEDLRLKCSIGIGPNKFLAKMASDMKKPMGITILRKSEISKKLWPLDISDMYGIGKKSVEKLRAININTIYDLANPANETKILSQLGRNAIVSIHHARGNGSSKLNYNHTLKSISQSTTLDKDILDYNEVKTTFNKLAYSLSARAKQEHILGCHISISIRYYDFTNIIRSRDLNNYTNEASDLLEAALLLFDQHHSDKSIRHLGISLGSLQNEKDMIQQLSFFDKQANQIEYVIEQLNDQIPQAHFIKASDLLKKDKMH